MNRRRSLPILLAVGVVLALVAMFFWRSEPRYGGRSLTDWAIQAQDYEKMALTDRPGYLAASNAIHRMGPAAAKAAVNWLDSDAPWQRSTLRAWIEKLAPRSGDIPRLNRPLAAAMILRLGTEEARLSVEPRLIAMLVSGGSGPITSTGQHLGPTALLSTFGAATWSRIEPLLLHTNQMVRMRALGLALSWTGARNLNLDILWQCRSNGPAWINMSVVDDFLFRHGAETNRLAEAIGSGFLGTAGTAKEPTDMIEHRAKQLSALGSAGSRYLEAGLTNGSEAVRIVSRRYLYR